MPKSEPEPSIDSVCGCGEKVLDEQVSVVSTRVPGAPVLTESDAKNLAQLQKEAKKHVDTVDNPGSHPLENQGTPGVATNSVTANVASRSNIVPDGPGTCETLILQEGNDPSDPKLSA